MIAQLTELSEAQRTNQPDRRIGERMLKGEAGSLQTLSPLSFDQSEIQVLDVSKDGFAVLSTSPVPHGAIVHVKAGKANLLGEVRYCRNADGGKFRAGIQFKTSRKQPAPVPATHHTM